jgi:hypothetical protein
MLKKHRGNNCLSEHVELVLSPQQQHPSKPSRVLHFRNVAIDISQSDIISLVKPFGNVIQLLILRLKNQALLQFESIEQAADYLDYAKNHPPTIRQNVMSVEYSIHQKLIISQTAQKTNGFPNQVLFVNLFNPSKPITISMLATIFSPFETDERFLIVTIYICILW